MSSSTTPTPLSTSHPPSFCSPATQRLVHQLLTDSCASHTTIPYYTQKPSPPLRRPREASAGCACWAARGNHWDCLEQPNQSVGSPGTLGAASNAPLACRERPRGYSRAGTVARRPVVRQHPDAQTRKTAANTSCTARGPRGRPRWSRSEPATSPAVRRVFGRRTHQLPPWAPPSSSRGRPRNMIREATQ
jgi:hypothetical protein